MSRTSYRTLVDQGRKAGLKTAELYRARSGRPPKAPDHAAGRADGNGFVPGLTRSGRAIYQPARGRRD